MTKLIDHHPIRFGYSTECNLTDHNWHQFAEYGDVTQFQMINEPCITEQNDVQNGGFTSTSDWLTTGSFSIDTGLGQATKAVGTSGTLTQLVSTSDGVLWKIQISATVTSGAFAVVFGDFTTYITETGDYTFWSAASNVTGIVFLGDGTTAGAIASVSAIPVNTDFEVYVVNEAAAVVHTFTSADIGFVNGFMTVSIDWNTESIPAGCYTLQVSDPCYCGQGGFVAQDLATGILEWYYVSGSEEWVFDELVGVPVIEFNPSGASTSLIEHASGVCSGTDYDVTYTIAGMVAGDTFQVRLGGATGTTRSTNGTFTDTISAISNANFKLYGTSTGATNYNVSALSIVATDRIVNYTSVPIKVSTTPIDCTYRINVCCDADNMGAGFVGTGFSPILRIAAQYAHGSMTSDRNSYEFSTGNKSTTYYRGRKNKSLRYVVPSYVHDFLMHAGGYDHVYIGSDEVFVEDDEYPTISYNDETDLGGVTLTLREKEVLIENRRCSSKVLGCNTDGVEFGLVDNGTSAVWIDPETGEIFIRG